MYECSPLRIYFLGGLIFYALFRSKRYLASIEYWR
nr:MAG TPA: hypothetical protein [Caudoviricetes sp.]